MFILKNKYNKFFVKQNIFRIDIIFLTVTDLLISATYPSSIFVLGKILTHKYAPWSPDFWNIPEILLSRNVFSLHFNPKTKYSTKENR
jgi:hypothetical protein